MSLNRRKFLTAAGVAADAVGTTLAAPAIAQSTPSVRRRLASSYPKSLDTIYGGCELPAKRAQLRPWQSVAERRMPEFFFNNKPPRMA